MAGIARAAADAKNEKTPAAFADGGQFAGALFNGGLVELRRDLLDFGQKFFCKAHDDFDCSSVSNSAKPAGEPIS